MTIEIGMFWSRIFCSSTIVIALNESCSFSASKAAPFVTRDTSDGAEIEPWGDFLQSSLTSARSSDAPMLSKSGAFPPPPAKDRRDPGGSW